jgi:hypothetical protein
VDSQSWSPLEVVVRLTDVELLVVDLEVVEGLTDVVVEVVEGLTDVVVEFVAVWHLWLPRQFDGKITLT